MSLDQSLQKAKLIPIDQNGAKKDPILVLFNPEQYSMSKGNQFASIAIPGRENPIIQFIKGQAETLALELLFDTRTYKNNVDVRTEYTNKISNLLKIDKHIHAPPVCIFEWGSLSFTGVIEKIDKKFTLFDKDGKPLRATIAMSFKQYSQPKEAVKTSSPNRTKSRIITAGDSLWLIAYREYGDPESWKLIADANNIVDPLNVKPGTEIILPPL